jgi:hypothetical protein
VLFRSPLLAAPLADYIFKPGMASGGALAPVLGPIFGVGASRGVGVMISLVGLLIMVNVVISFNVRRLMRVELDLPDHDSNAGDTSGTVPNAQTGQD